MKKLFALLLMLGGALSSWADGNSQLASNALNDGGVVNLRNNTSVEPENINQHVLTGATTVILPDGWTEAKVKTAGENLKNSSISFGTAVSTTNSPETTDITRNYYINDDYDRVYVANTGGINIDITETFYTSDNTLIFKESYSAYNDFNNQEVRVSSDDIQNGYYSPDVINNVTLEPFAKDGYNNEVKGWNLRKDNDKYYVTIQDNATNTQHEAEVSSWKHQYNGSWYSGSVVNIYDWGAIGTVNNSDHNISFKVDTYYVYSYTNGKGETKDTPRSTVELTEYTDSYQKYYTVYTETITAPTWTKLYAYVNTAGTLDNAIADATIIPNVTTQVTIIGNINNDDLAELKTVNFSSVEYLSMKDAVLDGDITTIGSKPTAAIILPKIKDGESTRNINNKELGTIQDNQVVSIPGQYNHTYDKYHCLSYFDNDDANKLNIYATAKNDNTVAKLKNDVSTTTSIKFIPIYNKDTGEFDNRYMGQGNTEEEFELFRAALGELPAISMDMSMINQFLKPDFKSLNPNTHYITVYGNVGTAYNELYDFTCETENSLVKYPSTVWVVTAYKVSEEEAFVRDENGNKIIRRDENGDIVYEDDNVTPKYNKTGYSTKVHYAGKFLEATEPTNLIYVRNRTGLTTDGETPLNDEIVLLDGAKNYFTNEQLYATRQIFIGDLNENEIAAINNDIHGDYFDFMYGANFTETNTIVGEGENAKALESVVKLHNDNVKYILLPSGHEYNINSTSANNCSFSANCSKLLCVGAYNTTDKSLTAWAKQNLDENGVQIPSLYVVTGLINKNTSIENLTLSGYYCRRDVKTLSAVADNSGLINATIKTADLRNAVFAPNSEMVLSMAHDDASHPGASWGSLTSILLPTSSSQKVLPAYCLDNTASLTSLCIPSNYETIGANALHLSGVTHIYTTAYEGDDFRDDENVYDHGEYTITLSSNLKHIETGAFCTGNQKWTDVYCLRKEAPTCAAGAFNSMNTYANNTYAGLSAHPVERANYKKADDMLMTVLHYPVTCTEDEAKNYTDIKRKYSLIDETGAYDGEGNLMRWPNQSEFMRSYNQAVAGLTWDTWSDARIPVGAPTANELLDTGLYGGGPYDFAGTTYVTKAETQDDYHISTGWNGQILETYTPSFIIDNDKVYDYNNYRGWHEFVLCQSVSVDRIVPKDPTTYVQGDWYTLCLPYDLTREQVLSLIGIPANENVTYAAAKGYQASDGSWFPQVYTLTGVTRKYPTITLTFSQELMRRLEKGKGDVTFNDAESTTAASPVTYKTSYDYSEEETNGQTTAGSNNKIYLKGGFPYLVRPILPAGTTIDGTLGQYMLKVGSFDKSHLGHQATVANGTIAAPIVNQKFIARNGTEKIDFKVDEETTSKYYYYFVGTYTEEMIPAYAYHLSGGSWSRTEDESKTWQPFTAIIGGKCTDEGAVYETDNPNSNGKTGLTTYYVSLKNQDDNFVTAGQHNIQYLITFEDEEGEGEVVAIDKIDGRDINNAISSEGNVYNMTGQFVGNSLNGLAKGIYLVNGKKVLVK